MTGNFYVSFFSRDTFLQFKYSECQIKTVYLHLQLKFVDLTNRKCYLAFRYPREKSQGVAFEKTIAPVDLIISLECKPVILQYHCQSPVSLQIFNVFFFSFVLLTI